MKTTCIMCPVGCELTITKKGSQITVSGNRCIRGKQYGENEFTCPKRIVTSVIKTKTGYASVKTTTPINKNLIFKALDEISKIPAEEYKQGGIVLKHVCGTDADIVITGIS